MQIVDVETLRQLARDMLIAAGTEFEAAVQVSDSLINANLAGHDSHGVMRLMLYLDVAQEGGVDPRAVPELVRQDRATATIDGKWGWGQTSDVDGHTNRGCTGARVRNQCGRR